MSPWQQIVVAATRVAWLAVAVGCYGGIVYFIAGICGLNRTRENEAVDAEIERELARRSSLDAD
jgi:hypothetical protein